MKNSYISKQQKQILKGLQKDDPELREYNNIPLEALLILEELGIQKDSDKDITNYLNMHKKNELR